MDCIIVGDAWQARQAQMDIENADERWRCRCASVPEQALHAVTAGGCAALYLLEEQPALLDALQAHVPCDPPWIITSRAFHPAADMQLEASQAARLPALLDAQPLALPRLCTTLLPRHTAHAAALLHTLGMPSKLKAWAFLPDMLALSAAHRPLLNDLSRRLYPLTAQRHRLSPACVERRLRTAVESTWDHSSIDTLDRFFGQTIDPGRGKPTNKQFICCISEYLLYAEISPD